MKHADHKKWVLNEFKDDYLKPAFRNTIIHFSFVESIVMYKAGGSFNNFSIAIKFLLCSSIISKDEFCLLDKMGNNRNTLVHKIIKNHLDQDQIDSRIKVLMTLIKTVYKEVNFIKEYLLNYYSYDTTSIEF